MTPVCEKVLTLQKPVQMLKKKTSKMLIPEKKLRESHEILWNLVELLKSYKQSIPGWKEGWR